MDCLIVPCLQILIPAGVEMRGRFCCVCVLLRRLPAPLLPGLRSCFTPTEALCCDLVFQMMKHAWDSYRQYGWGHNELKPLAKKGHSTNIFGRPNAAAGARWHGAVHHK